MGTTIDVTSTIRRPRTDDDRARVIVGMNTDLITTRGLAALACNAADVYTQEHRRSEKRINRVLIEHAGDSQADAHLSADCFWGTGFGHATVHRPAPGRTDSARRPNALASTAPDAQPAAGRTSRRMSGRSRRSPALHVQAETDRLCPLHLIPHNNISWWKRLQPVIRKHMCPSGILGAVLPDSNTPILPGL